MLENIEKTIKQDSYLNRHRGSEVYENIRLNTETFVKKGNNKPKVFLLTFGNLAMRKARASFATNFYGCAGFKIVDSNGFDSAQEGLNEAIKSKADIVVLCSSDDEYLDFAKKLIQISESKSIKKMIVAGYPVEQIEALKSIGITDYIHIKTDIIANLVQLQKELLITN